jgi:hypothetical protein
MNCINISQLEIDKNKTKFCEKTFKHPFKYLKERDNTAYKMNKNMVNVLSNLNSTMCHAFIKDKSQMLPPTNISKSLSNDLALPNSQDTNEN